MSIIDVKKQIQTVMVGQEFQIDLLLCALVSGGHVLLEDMPGTGKTMMAKSLAAAIDGTFTRVQFTPDLLPADVTGLSIYNMKTQEFEFHPGPVFTNVLLADEINRATPRTQSSLLECMEEHQVTIDGNTSQLPPPFLVIATQNPIETAGTYPLPEAQTDRFLLWLSMDPLSKEEEIQVMERFGQDHPLQEVKAAATTKEITEWMEQVRQVYVHPDLYGYLQAVCQATREDTQILLGVSTRGTLALLRCSRAYAFLQGRDYVIPEDIRKLAEPVLAHRILLQGGAMGHGNGRIKIRELLEQVPVPTEEWRK